MSISAPPAPWFACPARSQDRDQEPIVTDTTNVAAFAFHPPGSCPDAEGRALATGHAHLLARPAVVTAAPCAFRISPESGHVGRIWTPPGTAGAREAGECRFPAREGNSVIHAIWSATKSGCGLSHRRGEGRMRIHGGSASAQGRAGMGSLRVAMGHPSQGGSGQCMPPSGSWGSEASLDVKRGTPLAGSQKEARRQDWGG